MDEIAKNLLFQAGFAGAMLIALAGMFYIMMQYIQSKDKLHATQWEGRENRFIGEQIAWRETVATALRNNTTAMEKLVDVIHDAELGAVERHNTQNEKLGTVIGRLEQCRFVRGG